LPTSLEVYNRGIVGHPGLYFNIGVVAVAT
jgi:hypothetical protein